MGYIGGMTQVLMRVELPATVKKKGKWFISTCPLVDVTSQGETEEKAIENLVDALSFFFVSCFERGTLDDVLTECGFIPAGKPGFSHFPKNTFPIDVPIPFLIDPSRRGCPA